MKIYNYAKILTISVALTAASCQSHEQKSDESFELFKEEKKKAENDVDSVVKVVVVQKPGKVEYVVQKGDHIDEWSVFRTEIYNRLLANDERIKAFKKIQNIDSKVFKKISNLEKNNYDLRKKLNEFIIDEKAMRDQFKADMAHSVNLVDTAIRMIIVK